MIQAGCWWLWSESKWHCIGQTGMRDPPGAGTVERCMPPWPRYPLDLSKSLHQSRNCIGGLCRSRSRVQLDPGGCGVRSGGTGLARLA